MAPALRHRAVRRVFLQASTHGFGVAQKDVAGEFTLECGVGDKVIGSRRVTVRTGNQSVAEVPLRLDRLNRGLPDRLAKQAASRDPAVQGVAAYVAQHNVVYESPAPNSLQTPRPAGGSARGRRSIAASAQVLTRRWD